MDIDFKELIGFAIKEFFIAIVLLAVLSLSVYPTYQSALENQTINPDTRLN